MKKLIKVTDSALEYIKSEPQGMINKELYMEHDENVMKMLNDFYEKSR